MALKRHFRALVAFALLLNVPLVAYFLGATQMISGPPAVVVRADASKRGDVATSTSSEDDDDGSGIAAGMTEETAKQAPGAARAELFHLRAPPKATPPLLPALSRENGLRRLIQVIEQQVRAEAVGGCAGLTDAHPTEPPCITERLLTGTPVLRTFTEAFMSPLLRGMRNAFDRQNNLNRVSHSKPAYPLISGDGFKFVADVQCDTKPNQRDNCDFDPQTLLNRSVIFVNTHNVPHLVAKLPKITVHFFVITHNRDRAVPGPLGVPLLNSPYLLKWFGKNLDRSDPKMVPIPIGIENRWYKNGRRPENYIDAISDLLNVTATQTLLASFKIKAQYRARSEAMAAVRRAGLADRPRKVGSHRAFLELIRQHQFVLSPPGNGITCHRTWETLYMGRIPILLSSAMDPAYSDLPVLLVRSWAQLTPAFLAECWQTMQAARYDFDKLWQPHWLLFLLRVALQTP